MNLEMALNLALTTVRKLGPLKVKEPMQCLLEDLPQQDIDHAKTYKFYEATADLSKLLEITKGVSTGVKWYPKGGYMSWHTNSDNPGKRLYAVYNLGRGSIFRKEKDIEIEPKGWTIREFNCPIWHCVYANCYRIAFGFKI